jgi:hypothetical protein
LTHLKGKSFLAWQNKKTPLKKRNFTMLFSETIVTLLIWVLTAAGLFFGLRAFWRRRH